MCIRVNSCCCGSSVSDGTKYLAITNVVFGILGMLQRFTAAGSAAGVAVSILTILINVLLYYGAK
jgi:hypothetical protein